MVTTWLWWSKRSSIAVATTGSPRTVLQSPTARFDVITITPRSYRRLTSWNNRWAASGSNRQAEHFQILRAARLNENRARDHRLRVQGAHDLIIDLRTAHDVKRGIALTVAVRKRCGTDQYED
jgi:hypothetical protein